MATPLMPFDDPTIPPRYIVEGYRQAYARIHEREPICRYIGNHWYNVNGETVHRTTLMEEIMRLRSIAPRGRFVGADKSVVQRLISRLRGH